MDKELQEWYQLHMFHLYAGSFKTKELAEFLGVSERTIQRWLKEKARPKEEQLAKIAQYIKLQNKAPEPL